MSLSSPPLTRETNRTAEISLFVFRHSISSTDLVYFSFMSKQSRFINWLNCFDGTPAQPFGTFLAWLVVTDDPLPSSSRYQASVNRIDTIMPEGASAEDYRAVNVFARFWSCAFTSTHSHFRNSVRDHRHISKR